LCLGRWGICAGTAMPLGTRLVVSLDAEKTYDVGKD